MVLMEFDGIVSPAGTAEPRAPEHGADGDHTLPPAWAGAFGTEGRLRAVPKPCLMMRSGIRGHHSHEWSVCPFNLLWLQQARIPGSPGPAVPSRGPVAQGPAEVALGDKVGSGQRLDTMVLDVFPNL